MAIDFRRKIITGFIILFSIIESNNAIGAGSVGVYPATTVVTGANTTVSPNAPPSGVTTISVIAPTSFTGIVTANPANGVVSITNAKPAGTYTLSVYSGAAILQTFSLTVTTGPCIPGSFGAGNILSLSTSPAHCAVGDFNGDGNQDVLVANSGSANVSVRIGSGTGTFSGSTNILVGTTPLCVAVADFNCDGKQDFVTANSASATVSIRMGNGTGGFTGTTNIAVGTAPNYIATGDFNGDGNYDFAVTNQTSNDVSIRLGDGTGNFTSAANITLTGSPRCVVVGDFNKDNIQDLAISDFTNSMVVIKLGSGSGTFSGSSVGSGGSGTTGLAIGDFNSDFNLDLAVCNTGTVNTNIIFGDGLGNFGGTTLVNTGTSVAVAVGDLNNDGKLDLAVANNISGNNFMTYRIGNGTGGFTNGTNISSNRPIFIAVADFNKDGVPDLFPVNNNSTSTQVIIGNQSGEVNIVGNGLNIPDGNNAISITNNTFIGTNVVGSAIAKGFTIQNTGPGPLALSSITFTGTNASDFSWGGFGPIPTVLSSGGSLNFVISMTASALGTRSAVIHLNTNDCDESDYDFAVEGTAVPVTLNDYPDTSIKLSGNILLSPLGQNYGINSLSVSASSDFSGLIAVNGSTGEVRITDAKPRGIHTISVTNGTLTQSFILVVDTPFCSGAGFATLSDLTAATGAGATAIGDFNNDNIQDIVVCNRTAGSISVFKGLGNGNFTSYTTLTGYTNPDFIVTGYFNSGLNQDIAFVANSGTPSSTIIILNGNGINGFSNGFSINPNFTVTDLATGNFNGDPYTDLLISRVYTYDVLVKLGSSSGSFTGTTTVSVGEYPGKIIVADFNRDGKQDFATANGNGLGQDISVRLGNGAGGFTGSTHITLSQSPVSLACDDFNNDGIPDLAVQCSGQYWSDFNVLLGTGTGTFTTNVLYLNTTAYDLAPGDFNGDGKTDILFNNGSIACILGNGIGNFGTPFEISNNGTTQEIVTGDFNSDGIQDFTFSYNGKLGIRLGLSNSATVSGNGIVIPDSSYFPTVFNNTDFGQIAVNGYVIKDFVVANNGIDPININGVNILGPNFSEFSVVSTSSYNLNGHDSTIIRIKCAPLTAGIKNAEIWIGIQHCILDYYSFSIAASALNVPAISYSNLLIKESADTIISPIPPMTIQNTYLVNISSKFKGKIFVDEANGKLTVIDAKPQGIYPVTITAGGLSSTFTMTVGKPGCSTAWMKNEINTYGVYDATSHDIGDFNNDGYRDFINANSFNVDNCYIDWYLGPYYYAPHYFTIPNGTNAFALNDFDRDGNLDIASVLDSSSDLTVSYGNGNLGFASTFTNIGGHATFINSTDFNNDGFPDLLIGFSQVNNVAAYMGSLSGFTVSSYTVLNSTLIKILSSDFNNDGKSDFAVLKNGLNNDSISICLGNGLGNFTLASNILVPDSSTDFCVRDFNNDGKEDVAVFSSSSRLVSTYLGNGSGSFSNGFTVASGFRVNDSGKIISGDFNGDGNADIAASLNADSLIEIQLGTGTGNFIGSTSMKTVSRPGEMLVTDFNDDGIQDVLTYLPDEGQANIAVYLGQSAGLVVMGRDSVIENGSTMYFLQNQTDLGPITTLFPETRVYKLYNPGADSVRINGISLTGADASSFSISGISFPYIIPDSGSVNFTLVCNATTSGTKNATIHVSNTTGCGNDDYDYAIRAVASSLFIPNYADAHISQSNDTVIVASGPPVGTSSISVSAADNFTGILTINQSTGNITITNPGPLGEFVVTIKSGTTSKSFNLTVHPSSCGTAFTLSSMLSQQNAPTAVAVLDFNHDGKQDIAIGRMFENASNVTEVKFGNGQGGFTSSFDIPAAGAVSSLAVADFNNDGFQDVAMAMPNQATVRIAEGNGVGALNNSYFVNVGNSPNDIVAADFNKDGWMDFATANSASNNISIRLGNSSHIFTSAASLSTGINPRQMAVNDFDYDGNMDLVVTVQGNNTAKVFFGNGTGAFPNSVSVNTNSSPQGVAIIDYDRDNLKDIVVASPSTNSMNLFKYNGGTSFVIQSTYTLVGINDFTVCDFNGDGFEDLIGANLSYSSAWLLKGSYFIFDVSEVSVANESNAIAHGEFDGDNIIDFVTASTSSNDALLNFGMTKSINIYGNNNIISDGSISTSAANFTDFGTVVQGDSIQKSFVITNRGYNYILIDSISFSGTDAGNFIINDSTTFYPFYVYNHNDATVNVKFKPTSVGVKNARMHVYFSDCSQNDYDFAISGTAIFFPILGTYQNISMRTGEDSITFPSAPAAAINALHVTAGPNFGGVITADPTTGNVYIMNAKPAGTYFVTIKDAGTIVRTFVLTVTNPLCSQAGFTKSAEELFGPSAQICIGDFNEDGNQDIASSNFDNGNVVVGFGDGNGNFDSSYAIGGFDQPIFSAVADFNGDGHQDLAVANFNSSSVEIMFGDGLGSFPSVSNISVSALPRSIAVGDYNGDGKMDFVVACTNTLYVKLGNGTGGFTNGTNVTLTINYLQIISADFNNDGKSDIISANNPFGNLSIRLGNGLGGFTGSGNITVSGQPSSIAAADFNRDGKMDIVYSDNSITNTAGFVYVKLGDGLGGFGSAITLNAVTGTNSIATGDFNGDGKQDIAAGSNGSNEINIYVGNGSGGFTSVYRAVADYKPTSLAVGDLNRDGILDIVSGNKDNSTVSVLLGQVMSLKVQGNLNTINDGSVLVSAINNTNFGLVYSSTNTFRNFTIKNDGADTVIINSITVNGTNASEFVVSGLTTPVTLTGGQTRNFKITFTPLANGLRSATIHVNGAECAAVDYDFLVSGNVVPFVAPAMGNYNAVTVQDGSGINVIPSAVPTGINKLSAFTSSLFKGLLTADPVTGIVTVANARPAGIYTVSVKYGTTLTRTFVLTVTNPNCSQGNFGVPYYAFTQPAPSLVAVGDFNNDNFQDIVSGSATLSSELFVSMGQGGDYFDAPILVPVESGVRYLVVGDLNGDGNEDLVSVGYVSAQLSVRLSNGSGGFVNGANVSVGTNPVHLALGDVNNDGYVDIICVNATSNNLSVRLGDGIGGFTNAPDISATAPVAVAIGNFNADNNADIAIAYSSSFVVKNGDGTGNFSTGTIYSAGSVPSDIVVCDVNNDSKLDLAYLLSNGNLAVRIGDGLGAFGAAINTFSGLQTSRIIVGDYNGDGKQDFAVSYVSGSSLTLLYGNGLGSFNVSSTNNIGFGQNNAAAGDFNNDNFTDLALVQTAFNTVSVLRGLGVEINVTGNSNPIPDGSISYSLTNYTDFGNVSQGSPLTYTYRIINSGTELLNISSVTKTGANTGDFSITIGTLPVTMFSHDTLLFTVAFNPTASGIRTATIHVNNDDCNEADYDFAIKGFGLYSCSGNISDNDVCTNDACDPLNGITHTPVNLSDNNVCTTDACDPVTGPFNTPVPFNDNNACTFDGCNTQTGIYHLPVPTNDNDLCTTDACDPSTGVSHTPINTNDGNACTNDGCSPASGVYHLPVNINDNNVCTTDGCDPVTGVSHTPVNTDDGLDCTIDGCHPVTGIYHTPVQEICGNGIDDDCDNQIDEGCSYSFQLKLFIEGFYYGNNLMRAVVDSVNYPLLCDTITVELRSAINTANIIYTEKVLVTTSGIADFEVPISSITSPVYIAIFHRNAIETWSSVAINPTGPVYYDFTDLQTRAFGSNLILTSDLMNYAIFSGDIISNMLIMGKQDGMIDHYDYDAMEIAVYFTTYGYIPEDLSGDGQTESYDYMIMENNSFYAVIAIRP